LHQKNNYPSAAGVPGYGCGGITIIGASGEEYLYSGIWVRIEYLEYSQNIFNLKLCAYHLDRGFFCDTLRQRLGGCSKAMYQLGVLILE
jgi:hypothetical protein